MLWASNPSRRIFIYNGILVFNRLCKVLWEWFIHTDKCPVSICLCKQYRIVRTPKNKEQLKNGSWNLVYQGILQSQLNSGPRTTTGNSTQLFHAMPCKIKQGHTILYNSIHPKSEWLQWSETAIFLDFPQQVCLRTQKIAEKHVEVGISFLSTAHCHYPAIDQIKINTCTFISTLYELSLVRKSQIYAVLL